MIKNINIYNPGKLVFGSGVIAQLTDVYVKLGFKKIIIISVSAIKNKLTDITNKLNGSGIETKVIFFEKGEPSFSDYEEIRNEALAFKAQSIAGIGGGSVMDLAKIIAALLNSDISVQSVVGNGLIKEKGAHLICAPTTSGTGSEVSPNSILIDDQDGSKKGIISPYLVPDSSYIDPDLTISLPPAVTAYTGLDALTHCIEAYANKNAHPLIDSFALRGINMICTHLKRAFEHGEDIEARSNIAMGSVFGGMCLGPVNTAAVHALAYPLGTDFKIPHGLSNAVLLPYVMKYNLSAAPDRYAQIAKIAGANSNKDVYKTAEQGINIIKKLINDCRIKPKLSDYNISESSIDKMSEEAFKVQRLLKNNVRTLDINDIKTIYKSAY